MNAPRSLARLGLIVLLLSLQPAEAAVYASHDKAWWQALAEQEYAPPAGVSLEKLLQELSAHLGSPDPVLRDEIGYGVLTQWLYVQDIVPLELRRQLVATWKANLRYKIGERNTDTVFLRSFSALMLSVAVALDNRDPWLHREEFDDLLAVALSYLRDEQDTRGFDGDKGWVHAIAHTADLLKFLGRSRYLQPGQQALILNAISDRITTIDHPLVQGEDERLARAMVSLAARADFDDAAFAAFLETLTASSPGTRPTSRELALDRNRRHLGVTLFAILATDSRDLEPLQQARGMVLASLRKML